MNAREFYNHLRETNHRDPAQLAATPDELANPATVSGLPRLTSTNPLENVIGKLETATSIIGSLISLIGSMKGIIDRGVNVESRDRVADVEARLASLGLAQDIVPTEEVVAARPGTIKGESTPGTAPVSKR